MGVEQRIYHRHAFEALDKKLRDIMGVIDPKNRDIPFGNKVIVLGGYFRQNLLVDRKGTKTGILKAADLGYQCINLN
jgi:hypothetical protein